MPHELRYALRMIRVHPWFSAAVVAALALGIGANAAVFTLVNAVLFKPLPFHGGDRLLAIFHATTSQPRVPISYPDYLEYRDQNSTFEELEASQNDFVALGEPGNPPTPYSVARVTPRFLDMLAVQPILGRSFNQGDFSAGAPPVLLISHYVWRDRYGLAADVLGKAVRVGNQPATIIGVMPEGFGFPNVHRLWLPLVNTPEINKRSQRNLMLVGIRKPGIAKERARADLSVIAHRLAAQYPEDDPGIDASIFTFHELQNAGPIRVVFLLMQGAVGFVLLIACANVANMMLSHALGRTREMSVRASIGATRGQLLRQMLVEAFVLSVIGGGLGLLVARYAVRAFDLAVADVGKPTWILFEMDYTVFLYFAAMCLLSAVLFGLAPALQASRTDLNATLKEGSRDSGSKRGGRLAGMLVVVQFTLALVLLVGAGLFVRGLVEQRSSMDGLPLDHVLSARIQLPEDRYADNEARFRFYDRLLVSLGETSGVQRAEIVTDLPGEGAANVEYQVEGAPEAAQGKRPTALRVAASPGYLSSLDVPMLAGRAFDDRDGLPGRESVIVTRDFASRVWPGQSPLGKRLRFYSQPPPGNPANRAAPPPSTPGQWFTVVGISGDLEQRPQEMNPSPLVIVPYAPGGFGAMAVVLRSSGDPHTLAAPLRAAVQSLDPDRALANVQTLEERVQRQGWYLRVFGSAFLIFAAGALLLASIGIYAVVAQTTARRTQEIGIRMALGATARSILTLVVGRGVKQLAIGLVAGLTVAFGVTRYMREILFGISPHDPLVFAAVVTIVAAVGLAACWMPARRAAQLPPVEALRGE